jgi:hypothetical protein
MPDASESRKERHTFQRDIFDPKGFGRVQILECRSYILEQRAGRTKGIVPAGKKGGALKRGLDPGVRLEYDSDLGFTATKTAAVSQSSTMKCDTKSNPSDKSSDSVKGGARTRGQEEPPRTGLGLPVSASDPDDGDPIEGFLKTPHENRGFTSYGPVIICQIHAGRSASGNKDHARWALEENALSQPLR